MTEIPPSIENVLLEQYNKRKLAFYRPYPKQSLFHSKGATYRERLLRAGNQLGKTYSAAAETAIHATGKYPEWWEGKRFRKAPVIWCAGVTGEVVRDTIQRLLVGSVEAFGTGLIPHGDIIDHMPSRGVADLIDTILVRHSSGGTTRIRLKYYEQGREKFQGDTVDFGWCIAKDELVQMSDGRLIPIQHIKVGDYVFTIDNKGKRVSRRVNAVHENGKKKIIEARLSRGVWLRLTEDHEVFEGVRLKKKVKEACKIYQLPGDWEPDSIENKIDAFYSWAGLILSEGYIKGRKITMGDCKTVESAIKMLPKNARVRKKIFSNNHVPDWYLYWDEIWKLFPNALSHEKKIPDFIFTSGNKKIALFLSYLFSGDGWASGHTIGYATTSRIMANQISCLLARLGIRSTINKRQPQRKEWREQWWVMITSADHVLSFIEKIGIVGKDPAIKKLKNEAMRRINNKSASCSHRKKEDKDRKFDVDWLKKRNKRHKNRFAKINGIESIGEEIVYDLSIETNHSFCLGTSIVSNCDEEPPEDIYLEMLTRTNATGGIVIMTFTPLKGMSVVVRRFLKEHSPDRCDVNMTIEDAQHIQPAERQRIIDSYPLHERDARIRGEPMLGSGAIFPVADEDIMCDPFPMDTVPFFWMELAALDFGWDHPTAAVKGLYNPQDDIIYITNTYRRREATPLQHASALKAWGNVPFAWPHDGLQHDKGSGTPLKEIYRQQGLNMLPENARFEDGSNGVEAGLAEMLMRMETGRWKVFRHLNEWFEEKRMYHRREGKVWKEFDDLMAASRYLTMDLRFAKRVNAPKGMMGQMMIPDTTYDSYNDKNYNPLDPKYVAQQLGINK